MAALGSRPPPPFIQKSPPYGTNNLWYGGRADQIQQRAVRERGRRGVTERGSWKGDRKCDEGECGGRGGGSVCDECMT
jgi:hypothetical protein